MGLEGNGFAKMGSKDASTTTIERLGQTLRLRFEPRPLNAAAWIGGVVSFAAAGLIAFWVREPGLSVAFVTATGVATVIVAGASILIIRRAGTKMILTEFELEQRRIRISTELRGRGTQYVTFGFDDITELRVLQQTNKGSQIETLSLGVRGRPFINIADEQRDRAYSTKPFGTPLKDIADQIAVETGLPRGKPAAAGLAGVASMIGIRRS